MGRRKTWGQMKKIEKVGRMGKMRHINDFFLH